MAYVYEETAQAEDETNDQVVVGVPGSMKYHTTYQMSPEDDGKYTLKLHVFHISQLVHIPYFVSRKTRRRRPNKHERARGFHYQS